MNSVLWVPLVVAITFAILRKLLPAKGAENPVSIGDEERATFRKWEAGTVPALLVFGAALTGLWYLIMSALAAVFLPSRQGVEFLIVPSRAYWLLPAIFLAIITSGVPTGFLYRRLLGRRYVRYEQYIVEKLGFDARRVLRGLALSVAFGVAIAFVCGVNSATGFTRDGIDVGRALSLSRSHYRYSQVSRIVHRRTFVAPNGNTVHRPHYEIEFSDGTTWSTRTFFRDPEPLLDAQLARFLASQSGRPIEEAP